MLQQTQVQTVMPYYARFLSRFPTVEKLAAAPTDEVLRFWAGLGYYSRALNLQKSAQVIVRQFGGTFPAQHATLLSLPGIGRYTAAALMSIAFGARFAVLDGNVTRVLSRLLALKGDPKRGPLHRELWRVADELLPEGKPGDFNQALMELGATVCLPKLPRCNVCPWESECSAYKMETPEAFPEKRMRPTVIKVRSAAILILRKGSYLIMQRPQKGILSGFWEFPSLELIPGDNVAKKLSSWLKADFKLDVDKPALFAEIRHTITNRRINLQVFQTVLRAQWSAEDELPPHKWMRLSQAWRYPFASASLQIIEKLRAIKPDRT